MYPASSAFHTAVADDNVRMRVLMRFADGTMLTGSDVSELEVTEPLNEETDLTVGKCVSANLRVNVLNYDGLLSDFDFGDCTVSLGALTIQTVWDRGDCICAVIYQYGTSDAKRFESHSAKPYLTIDGTAANAQPPFPPHCLFIVGATLYAAGAEGGTWVAAIGDDGTLTVQSSGLSWGDLATLTWGSIATRTWGSLSNGGLSDFMADKLLKWNGRGLWYNDKTCYEFTAGTVDKWEYVPLGNFHIDTPTTRQVVNIECGAYDNMQRFNVSCDDWWSNLEWPLTIGQLLTKLCTFVNVATSMTTFINSSVSIASAPMAANGLLAKDVLAWIAEAACSYARMSRDGELELVWFTTQDVTIPRHFGASAAEYSVPAITAVHAMAINSDLGVIVPDTPGDNAYQIIDNPLLYGDSEASIKPLLAPIYERLSGFASYSPAEIETVCDWSIQAGDIVQVVTDSGTLTLPIFRQVIVYGGGFADVTYECTGGVSRKPASSATRKLFSQHRAYHKLEISIAGLSSEIGDVKGNVTELNLTAEGLNTRITNAENNFTSLQLTVSGLETRVENAEGDYSSLTQTVNQLRSEVSGKIDGNAAQTLIDQTVDKITLEVSSSSGGTTLVLKSNGVELSSDTVDLHVKSVNVDGEIKATSVDFDTATINGVLKAQYVDAENLHVKSANIDGDIFADNVYANNIVGGTGTLGGYIPCGAISDTGHALDNLNTTALTIGTDATCGGTMRIGGAGSYVTIGGAKVTLVSGGVTTEADWPDILAGGSGGVAVFG